MATSDTTIDTMTDTRRSSEDGGLAEALAFAPEPDPPTTPLGSPSRRSSGDELLRLSREVQSATRSGYPNVLSPRKKPPSGSRRASPSASSLSPSASDFDTARAAHQQTSVSVDYLKRELSEMVHALRGKSDENMALQDRLVRLETKLDQSKHDVQRLSKQLTELGGPNTTAPPAFGLGLGSVTSRNTTYSSLDRGQSPMPDRTTSSYSARDSVLDHRVRARANEHFVSNKHISQLVATKKDLVWDGDKQKFRQFYKRFARVLNSVEPAISLIMEGGILRPNVRDQVGISVVEWDRLNELLFDLTCDAVPTRFEDDLTRDCLKDGQKAWQSLSQISLRLTEKALKKLTRSVVAVEQLAERDGIDEAISTLLENNAILKSYDRGQSEATIKDSMLDMLPPSWKTLRDTWSIGQSLEKSGELMNIGEIECLIRAECQDRLSMQPTEGLYQTNSGTAPRCYNCGATGHVKKYCRENCVCTKCGVAGHHESICGKVEEFRAATRHSAIDRPRPKGQKRVMYNGKKGVKEKLYTADGQEVQLVADDADDTTDTADTDAPTVSSGQDQSAVEGGVYNELEQMYLASMKMAYTEEVEVVDLKADFVQEKLLLARRRLPTPDALYAILDKGATRHAFNSASFFVDWNEHPKTYKIGGALSADDALYSTKQGTARMLLANAEGQPEWVHFRDAMLVEDLPESLVSEYQYLDCELGMSEVSAKSTATVIVNGEGTQFPVMRDGNHAVLIGLDEERALVANSHELHSEQEVALVAAASRKGQHRVRKMTLQALHNVTHLSGTILTKTIDDHMPHVELVGPRTLKRCVTCGIAKMTEQHLERSEDAVFEIGEHVSVDIFFPNVAAIITGNIISILFVERKTYLWKHYGMKTKDEAGAKHALYLACLRVHLGASCRPKYMLCDNDSVFLYKYFKALLDSDGTEQRTSVAYSQAQNGRAEVSGRYLFDSERAHRVQSEFGMEMWEFAANYSEVIHNSFWTTEAKCVPLLKLTKSSIEYRLLFPFGCVCLGLVPKKLRTKLENKAHVGVFVGYPDNQKGVMIYVMGQNKVIVSNHVIAYPECITALDRRGIRWKGEDFNSLQMLLEHQETSYTEWYGDYLTALKQVHGDDSIEFLSAGVTATDPNSGNSSIATTVDKHSAN